MNKHILIETFSYQHSNIHYHSNDSNICNKRYRRTHTHNARIELLLEYHALHKEYLLGTSVDVC